MAADDLDPDDLGRQQQQWCARPSSLSEPAAAPSKGSAPAKPKYLTLAEVFKLGLTTAQLVDLAAEGAIHVYARGARFKDSAISGSTPVHPTGTTPLGAAEAAYFLTHLPFDEIRVASSWQEMDVIMTPASIRFLAEEIRDLVKQAGDSAGINPKKEMTYLKLIAALLSNAKIDPRKRGTAVKLSEMIKDEFPDFLLDETTIRHILKKINDMS